MGIVFQAVACSLYRERAQMSGSKRFLLAGVSSIALAVSSPAVMAGDLLGKSPVYASAASQDPWTVWIEGGAQGLAGGNTYVAGLTNPAFTAPPTRWGWDGAVGLDYRFNGDWHISGDFRYGSNQQKRSTQNQFSLFQFHGTVTPVTGTNSATREEHNWVADFMVGRDIGLGAGTSQLKAGLRVAEIHGKTQGLATFIPSTANTITKAYVQTNKFLGVGPRLALEGNVPLGGAWSIDYMGGVAGLYGTRQFNQTVTTGGPGASSPWVCFGSGCPVNLSSNSDGMVFNPDAMLGLSYAIMPNTKLSINYRVDAYFGAMRVLDSAGNLKNTDRIDQGPNLRLTWGF